MGSTQTTIDGLLKVMYPDSEVHRLINKNDTTFGMLKTSPDNIGGKGANFSVNYMSNERGLGSISELEALHEPDVEKTVQGTILPKIITENLRFSGLSLEIANSTDEALQKNFTYQTEEGIQLVKKELNAQLFRDGTGRLAQVNGAVSAGTTITFDNGVPTHLRLGTYLDIYNGSTKEASGVYITDVSPFTNQVTVSAPITVSDNAWIFRENIATTSTGSTKEIPGFKIVTDNGTLASSYEGIDRTTYNAFDGITLNANGSNLSDDLLQDAQSRIQVISGSDAKNLKLIMNPAGQMRKYLAILTPMKQFVGRDQLDSGVNGPVPTWNGLELIEDTDCGFDEVYMIDFSDVMKHMVKDIGLDQTDGKVLKYESGKDSFTAYVKGYLTVGSKKPNRSLRINNFATPTYSY